MRFRLTVAALALTALAGCYTVRVGSAARPGAQGDSTNFHFIAGATSAKVAAVECAQGIASIEFQLPWWSSLLSFVTSGIVGASETKYTCVDAAGAKTSGSPGSAASAEPVAAR